MREEIEAARKSSEPAKIIPGVTDDEIAAAIRASGEGEEFECPHPGCGYKAKEKFDVCAKCHKPVIWE